MTPERPSSLPLSQNRFTLANWYPVYGPDAVIPVAGDEQMFIAEALHLVCEELFLGYDRDFPILATLPAVPAIPFAADAFEGDTPIAGVHRMHSRLVHATLTLQDLAGGSLIDGNLTKWAVVVSP